MNKLLNNLLDIVTDIVNAIKDGIKDIGFCFLFHRFLLMSGREIKNALVFGNTKAWLNAVPLCFGLLRLVTVAIPCRDTQSSPCRLTGAQSFWDILGQLSAYGKPLSERILFQSFSSDHSLYRIILQIF